MEIEIEIKVLLNHFLKDKNKNTIAHHLKFWSDDVIYVNSFGKCLSKQELLQQVESENKDKSGNVYQYDYKNLKIKTYRGNGVVWITFKLIVSHKTITNYFSCIATFIKEQDSWKAMSWQTTPVIFKKEFIQEEEES